MSTPQRVSFQSHKNVGFNRKNRPGRIASENELFQINKAIKALAEAKEAPTEKLFIERVSEAFNNCRQVVRSRIL